VKIAFALLALGWAVPVATPPAAKLATDAALPHPEARPFDPKAQAAPAVDAALARGKTSGKNTIIVLGANWCHDSRALAGWFSTPRFSAMIAARYELVYVDVGYRDRNLDIARRFGTKSLKGTPTVLIVNGEGKLLNRKTAPTWRDAASRSEDSIFRSFAEFTPA
jgi:hypothetical protein